MNKALMVDTAAWYALADISDQYHQRAAEFFGKIAGKQPLITTDFILAETWTLLNARLGRGAAFTFWSRLRGNNIPVMYSDQSDMEGAWHIAHTYMDQTFSLVDCVTMSMMERRGLTKIFTFDQHFRVFRFGPGRKHTFQVFP